MRTLKELSREADARLAGAVGRPVAAIRADLEAALEAEYPEVAAAADIADSCDRGALAIVAAAAAAEIDLSSPPCVRMLVKLSRSASMSDALPTIAALGFAGEILARPHARGVLLARSSGETPGEWASCWGPAHVACAGLMLLLRCPPDLVQQARDDMRP